MADTKTPEPRKTPDENIQAGAPLRDDHEKTSLNIPGEQTGRPRDEGPDAIERTRAQRPKREADATSSSDIDPAERETL